MNSQMYGAHRITIRMGLPFRMSIPRLYIVKGQASVTLPITTIAVTVNNNE